MTLSPRVAFDFGSPRSLPRAAAVTLASESGARLAEERVYLERFLLRLLGIKGIQGSATLLAGSNYFQHFFWIGQAFKSKKLDCGAYPAKGHASSAGMPHKNGD